MRGDDGPEPRSGLITTAEFESVVKACFGLWRFALMRSPPDSGNAFRAKRTLWDVTREDSFVERWTARRLAAGLSTGSQRPQYSSVGGSYRHDIGVGCLPDGRHRN